MTSQNNWQNLKDLLALWEEKLIFLEREKAIIDSPIEQFELVKRIEECHIKINDIKKRLNEGERSFELIKRIEECQKEIKRINSQLESLKLEIDSQPSMTKTGEKQQGLFQEIKSKMNILHLSDIHFGTLDQAQLWYGQLIEDLQQNLEINQLDGLILSGDIANKSTPEEYESAQHFLDELLTDFPLKSEQIIIVPGNHDLNWQLSRQAYCLKYKDECHSNELQEGFYIPISDDVVSIINLQKYPQRFRNFKTFYDRYKGNIKEYQLNPEEQYSLDIFGDNILILGLNSAWQLDHHYKSRASINDNTLTNALNEIRRNDTYKKRSLKIAVWHHPINSPFEDRIKDSNFLERLAVNDFKLFLHGHIHRAENDQFRYDLNIEGRQLHRICAGTFGASTKELNTGIPWQYNLLKIENKKITVYTRKKESENGAWEGDFRWRYGRNQVLDYYTIEEP